MWRFCLALHNRNNSIARGCVNYIFIGTYNASQRQGNNYIWIKMHLQMKHYCEPSTSTRLGRILELFVSTAIKNNLRAWYQLV